MQWLAGVFGAPAPSPSDMIQVWITLFAAITALSTLGLFVIALYQIPSIKEAEKKRVTIARCELFDTDPVIDRATQAIFERTQGKHYDYETVKDAAYSLKILANFFSGVAIGVVNGTYDETIVKQSFRENISRFVDCFITNEFAEILPRSHLPELIELRERWRRSFD